MLNEGNRSSTSWGVARTCDLSARTQRPEVASYFDGLRIGFDAPLVLDLTRCDEPFANGFDERGEMGETLLGKLAEAASFEEPVDVRIPCLGGERPFGGAIGIGARGTKCGMLVGL